MIPSGRRALPRPGKVADRPKPASAVGAKAPSSVVPELVHPSLAGMRLPVVRRRNQPASRRWGRPWATIAVVSAAMLASGVATTAWHLVRTPGERPDTVTAQPMQPAGRPSGPVVASRSAPAARTTAPGKPVAEQRGAAAGARVAARALTPVRPKATRTSDTRPRVKEARPYGPEDCKEGFTLAGFTPMMVAPCHARGTGVRIRATLTAPIPGSGRITVALQDTGTGRTVGSPKSCTGLTFTKAAPTHSCGPVTVGPARGHRYQVVMSWTFDNGQRSTVKVTRGNAFDW